MYAVLLVSRSSDYYLFLGRLSFPLGGQLRQIFKIIKCLLFLVEDIIEKPDLVFFHVLVEFMFAQHDLLQFDYASIIQGISENLSLTVDQQDRHVTRYIICKLLNFRLINTDPLFHVIQIGLPLCSLNLECLFVKLLVFHAFDDQRLCLEVDLEFFKTVVGFYDDSVEIVVILLKNF